MQKIKLMTDSASDIPDTDLERLDIDMLKIPIAVDGKAFYERDFTFDEFYNVLNNAKEIPVTSRISEQDYLNHYAKVYAQGYKTLINVTINAKGSGTYMSAVQAKDRFFEENPDALDKFSINVLDSKTYSLGYGYAVIKAAEMAKEDKSLDEILLFLNDWFSRVDIYLGCYTLKFAQKSGRIHFATAFVGEVLGMRPIMRLADGKSGSASKVRGDKNMAPGLFDIYKKLELNEDDELLIVYGEDKNVADELQELFKKERKAPLPMYQAGASIAINAGPKLLAIVCKGKVRK